MSESPRAVKIGLLGKEYTVGCPPEEEDDLRQAAALLDQRMREIRDGGRVVGVERIAIMAALNIANDLYKCRTTREGYHHTVSSRIRQIQEKIEVALNNGNQIEL